MNKQKTISLIQQAEKTGDDRASYFQANNREVFLLADGAGGSSKGAKAAEHFINSLSKNLPTKIEDFSTVPN